MAFSRWWLSLATVVALIAPTLGQAQFAEVMGALAGAGGAGGRLDSISGPLQAGRTRKLAGGMLAGGTVTELETGTGLDGDLSTSGIAFMGPNFPMAVYVIEGKAGQSARISVKSPDVHPFIWVSRTLTGSIGRSSLPKVSAPREAELTVTFKQDAVHYISIAGFAPNGKGGIDFGRYSSIGKFTITVADPAGTSPVRMVGPAAQGVPGTSAVAGAAPAAAGSLEASYAQLCSSPATAASETCRALQQAMIAKLAGGSQAKAPPKAAGKGKAGAARRSATAGKAATSEPASEVAAVAPVDPAAWAEAEAAVALSPGALSQSFTMPFGRTTQFELKVAKDQAVEVMVDLSQGKGATQVCHFPDAFLGSVEGVCPSPTRLDGQVAMWRFKRARPGEIQIKVSDTKGPAEGSYRVVTRPDTSGKGRAFLTRLERLAGRTYVADAMFEGLKVKGVYEYSIIEPGRSGQMRLRSESGTGEALLSFVLDGNGDLAWRYSSKSEREAAAGIVQPGADGALYVHLPEGRRGWLIAADGTAERIWDRRWSEADLQKGPAHTGSFVRAERVRTAALSPRAVNALLAAGPARIERAKAARMLDWGVLGQMADRSWIYTSTNGTQVVSTMKWEVPGYSLVSSYWAADRYGIEKPFNTMRLRHDAATGKITGRYDNGSAVSVQMTPLGEAVLFEGRWQTRYSAASPNDVIAELRSTSGTPEQYQQRYSAVDKLRLVSLADRARQLKAQRDAQAAAQAQAEQNSGGGFGGFLQQGLQAYQMMKDPAALQAGYAQAFNNLAPGLGDAYSAVAQGVQAGNSGIGAAGGGIGAVGGGASYPARPPQNLSSECPNFTIDNYKERAFQGGNDTQLYTLCAQAFALYAQYRNAIRQGYSQADSDRTYNAHSQAAAVVRNFRAEAR